MTEKGYALTEKDLLKPKSWAEIYSLPGHCIDVAIPDLGCITGDYDLPAKQGARPCGLRCHQPHRKGFIVRLKDGRLTHVGNRCGMREFPDWESQVTRYTKLATIKNLRETLARYQKHAKAEAGRTLFWEDQIKPYMDLLDQLYSELPNSICRQLAKRARSHRGRIIKETKRADIGRLKELKAEGLIKGSLAELSVDRTEIGKIEGVGAWNYHQADWTLLNAGVMEFLAINISDANEPELKDSERTWKDLKPRMAEARREAERLVTFLTPDNLVEVAKLLQVVSVSDEDRRRTLEALQRVSKAQPKAA